MTGATFFLTIGLRLVTIIRHDVLHESIISAAFLKKERQK